MADDAATTVARERGKIVAAIKLDHFPEPFAPASANPEDFLQAMLFSLDHVNETLLLTAGYEPLSDAEKVNFLRLRLAPAAQRTWFFPVTDRNPTLKTDFEALVKEFKVTFGNPNQMYDHVMEWLQLVQTGHRLPLKEYISRFQYLTPLIKLPDSLAHYAFLIGLDASLNRATRQQLNSQQAAETLDAAVAAARLMHTSNIHPQKQTSQGSAGRSSGTSANDKSKAAPSPATAKWREGLEDSPEFKKWQTKEYKAIEWKGNNYYPEDFLAKHWKDFAFVHWLRANQLCLNCRREGHQVNRCPRRQ
jgi:hypothetical protein